MKDPSFHRPAPWFVVQNGRQTDIHCRVKPDGEAPREFTVAAGINEDDARRIVACINALADIPMEPLEKHGANWLKQVVEHATRIGSNTALLAAAGESAALAAAEGKAVQS